MTTPLPAARPSAFRTSGKPNSPDRTQASASVRRHRRRGTAPSARAWRAMKSFANALLDSSRAAAAVGPKSGSPASAKRSATPRLSGSSGPTTVRSHALVARQSDELVGLRQIGREGTRSSAMPGVPGRAQDLLAGPFGNQTRDQRVLPRAATENKNSHALKDLERGAGVAQGEAETGTISLTLSENSA